MIKDELQYLQKILLQCSKIDFDSDASVCFANVLKMLQEPQTFPKTQWGDKASHFKEELLRQMVLKNNNLSDKEQLKRFLTLERELEKQISKVSSSKKQPAQN